MRTKPQNNRRSEKSTSSPETGAASPRPSSRDDVPEAGLSPDLACSAFEFKVDYFMRKHVLPVTHPERISWLFSLSGGKDSFAMAEGVRAWYASNALKLTAHGLAIDQWGGEGPRMSPEQIPWLDVRVVDAREPTLATTGYQQGDQAPCRACADVRRSVSDITLAEYTSRKSEVTFLARGLHLTDTAISLLWRLLRNKHTGAGLQTKWRPVDQLRQGFHLVKPLSYVREYESAAYAQLKGHKHFCCGCPACSFPSRRDIVEETAADLYAGSLWEFEVPGIDAYLRRTGTSAQQILRISAQGRHQKNRHIPLAAFDFAIEDFRKKLLSSPLPWNEFCDPAVNLDDLAEGRLRSAPTASSRSKLPSPAFLLGLPLSPAQRAMIGTMGPFWGAFALASNQREQALALQYQQWGFSSDDHWSQTNALLHRFHAMRLPARRRHLTVL